MRISKPSPAMIVALIALVFAMTGTGIAAKTMITGKQIKDRSITSKDLALNAVTAKNIASNAITERKLADAAVTTRKLRKQAVTADKVAPNAIGAGALAPNSVTTASLNPESVGKALCTAVLVPTSGGAEYKLPPGGCWAPTVCPNGVIVIQPPCPVVQAPLPPLPGQTVSANDVQPDGPSGVLNEEACALYHDVNAYLTFTNQTYNSSTAPFSPTDRLTVPQDGIYTVSATGTFAARSTGYRSIGVYKKPADSPFADEIAVGRATAVATEVTTVVVNKQVELKKGEQVALAAGSCREAPGDVPPADGQPPIQSVQLSMLLVR